MLQMKLDSSTLKLATLFRLPPEVFGSTQQTPILLGREIYGIRPNGQFVCLDFNGKVRWTSPSDSNFGLGSFLLAAGVFYVLNDSGMLSLIEATPEQYHQLAQVRVLQGTESWAPRLSGRGSRHQTVKTDQTLTRRDFLRRSALTGLSAVSVLLLARNSARGCPNNSLCHGCPASEDCQLPPAVERRQPPAARAPGKP